MKIIIVGVSMLLCLLLAVGCGTGSPTGSNPVSVNPPTPIGIQGIDGSSPNPASSTNPTDPIASSSPRVNPTDPVASLPPGSSPTPRRSVVADPSPTVSSPTTTGTPIAGKTPDPIDALFPGLPPEPDPVVNNQTVPGIDVDGDGVRDDVQRWVYRKYGGDQKKRKAFLQYARAAQEDLLAVDNKQLSIQKSRALLRAVGCLAFVFRGENFVVYNKLSEEIEGLVVNTDMRLKAEIKASSNFSGQIYDSLPYEKGSENCDL